MNRELWKNRSFERNSPTQYPCPKCFVGILKPLLVKTEITGEGEHMSNYNYPYGIEHIFSGLFKCTKNSCGEIISFGGICNKDIETGEELPNGELVPKYITIYEPKFFYPNLRLFKLPKNIDKEIKEQIDLSFSHYFNDLSSCANRIRTTVEVILDVIKAPKYKIANSGRRHIFRKLHNRIENFKKKKKTIAELLLAIKFIGNEGSHKGKVEVDDILDAYEILNEVIDMAFVNKRKQVMKIADEINQIKKPRSKK